MGSADSWIEAERSDPPMARTDGISSFDQFFATEYDGMIRVAFLIIGSNAEAEELVQDAFVKVYGRWPALDHPAGYLRSCVVNGCRDRLRRRARWKLRVPLLARTEALDEAESDDVLIAALRRLPAQQRTAIVLRFYQDLPGAEIASTLGISVPAVKSLLHRALTQLREGMSHER